MKRHVKVTYEGKKYELVRGKLARTYIPPKPKDPSRPVRFYRVVKGKVRLTWHEISELESLNQIANRINNECVEAYGKTFEVPTWDELDAIKKFRAFEDRRKTEGKPIPKLSKLVEIAIAREEAQEETPLFSEVVKLFLKDRRTTNPVSESRRQQCTSALKYFGKFFDKKRLSEIKVADVQRCLASREFAADTVASYSRIIRTTFNWWYKSINAGRRLVDCLANPLENLPTPKVTKTRDPEIISPETLKLYLEEARRKAHELLVAFVFRSFCGLRSSEISRLHWKDVGEKYVFLSCSITKTQVARSVILSENIASWLALVKTPKNPEDYVVCPNLTGPDRERKLNALRLKFARESNVKIAKNSLRHSAATYLSQLYGNAKAADFCGHDPHTAGVHYRALSTPEIAQKWFSVLPDPEEKAQ